MRGTRCWPPTDVVPPRDKAPARAAARRGAVAPSAGLSREQKLQLYYWMRLARTLEQRVVAQGREGTVDGELQRLRGLEAGAVGATCALEPRDVMSPRTGSFGALLVKGALPAEVLRQCLHPDGATFRGAARRPCFSDLPRGYIGPLCPPGDMLPVMAGVTLSFRLRGEDRVGLVFVGDGATDSGAFHEGIGFAAAHRCPLVVVLESRGHDGSTPAQRQELARRFVARANAYGVPGEQADGHDVLAVYAAVRRAVDRARAGEGVSLLDLATYHRAGHAEADEESRQASGASGRWAVEDDPLDRYARVLTGRERVDASELDAIDQRVRSEVEQAAADAESESARGARAALAGVRAEGHAR